MSKIITALAVLFVIFTFINGIYENGGGIAATELNGAIDDDDTTITVDSTVGFLSADAIVIGDEQIAYTGTTATSFTGCTRAYDQTDAEEHEDNSRAYTLSTNIINQSLGFNVASTSSTVGALSVATLTWGFLTTALPNMIVWDFAFLQGQMIIFRYILIAASIGVVVYLGIQMLQTAQGILTP